MAGKVAEASWLLCLLEGCISAFDSEIKRRPYHRNCSCALHKTRRSSRGHVRPCAAARVSYPLASNAAKPLRLARLFRSLPENSGIAIRMVHY